MPDPSLFDLPLLQLAGLFGAGMYVANYCAVTSRALSTESTAYFLCNLVAACLVLSSLGHAFNAAALVIQVFFVFVSIAGIASRLRAPPPERRARPRRGVAPGAAVNRSGPPRMARARPPEPAAAGGPVRPARCAAAPEPASTLPAG